eukprot:SAG11_NODE_4726_length_1791_cov_1.421986_1_plen_100_part_00
MSQLASARSARARTGRLAGADRARRRPGPRRVAESDLALQLGHAGLGPRETAGVLPGELARRLGDTVLHLPPEYPGRESETMTQMETEPGHGGARGSKT